MSLDFGMTNRVVFREGLPLLLNPNDAFALAMALGLKTPDEGEKNDVTLVSIGPEGVESYLKNGLAIGADKAMRIWDNDFTNISSYQKAGLLTHAVSQLGADLILTGAASLDTGNGQVGSLVAARLGLPFVSDVVELKPDKEQESITLTRDIGRGERERMQCPLPAVIAVKGEGRLPYASLDRLIESRSADISLFTPADLGINAPELKNEPTIITDLTYPHPRPRKVPPLDTSLPAFYRILQLLEGGISRRKGTMLEGSTEELAEQLFEILKEEGVIKPAKGQ